MPNVLVTFSRLNLLKFLPSQLIPLNIEVIPKHSPSQTNFSWTLLFTLQRVFPHLRESQHSCACYTKSFILGPSFSQTSWLTAFFFLPGLQKEKKRADYLLKLPCLDHKVYSVVKCPPAIFKEGIWWIAFKTL